MNILIFTLVELAIWKLILYRLFLKNSTSIAMKKFHVKKKKKEDFKWSHFLLERAGGPSEMRASEAKLLVLVIKNKESSGAERAELVVVFRLLNFIVCPQGVYFGE